MAEVRQQLGTEGVPYPDKLFTRELQGRNGVLYRMERGRTAQIEGQFIFSRDEYAQGMNVLQQEDDKALLTVRDASKEGAALIVNDRVLQYSAETYERIFLYQYQAQNYLIDGDVQGALVEVRRADAVQRAAEERAAGDISSARNAADKNDPEVREAMPRVLQAYAGMDELAGQVKSSFLSPYALYFSALCYELAGELGDAYIDYKRTLELVPENTLVQGDVFRLGGQLGMTDDLTALARRFPDGVSRTTRVPPGHGEVVIFVEDGFVAQKESVNIPIPLTGARSVVMISLPIYRHRIESGPVPCLTVGTDRQIPGQPLCDVNGLAVQALREHLMEIATRQILRAVAKGVAAKAAYDQLGPWGSILAGVWNVLSERADLRSWNTLPARVSVCRATVPVNTAALTLQAGHKQIPLNLRVREGGLSIVIVTCLENRTYVATRDFERVHQP